MTLQEEHPFDAEPHTVCIVDGCDNKFTTRWKTFGVPNDMTYEEQQKQPVILRREHCSPCAKADPDMMKRWHIDFIEKNKDALIANGNLDEQVYNRKKQEMVE